LSTKVLVTGGTGFLGTYIIRQLIEKGFQVRAIRRNSPPPFYMPATIAGQVEWIEGDILDIPALAEAMEGMDAVIHAAAKISFAAADRKDMLHTNIEGTANTVNMALEQNIPRFLHISSVSSLSRSVKGETITEDKKWEESRLNTAYGASKYYAEMEVWRGYGEGLHATIVNPSTILGYGDWNTSSCALFKSVFREFPWYTNGMNGFVDVQDVARAVVALLDSDTAGQRFILNGDNWTYRQLFNGIAKGFGKKPPSHEATPFLSGIAWRLEKIRSFFSGHPSLVSKETARIALSNSRYDNSRILQKLPGFHFTPLEETLELACRQYMEKPQPL
jgi:dihydroflavonol-4-reductase